MICGAEFLVALQTQLVERAFGTNQGHAAAGDNAFFQGRLRGRLGVFEQCLALFHFRLGGGTAVDLGHAAGQLGQPLLQLFAIVFAVSPLDFAANLLRTPFDGLLGCRPRR